MLRPIEEMHRQDELWVCTYDTRERVRTKLDRLNARERPFTIKPVPNPKPQNPYYPNTLETDDAAVFNFLSQQVSELCRYEQVNSGAAPLTSSGGTIETLSWAARYFYDLIQENSRPRDLIDRAKAILNAIATYLYSRQRGFGLVPNASRATDAYWGGILASGATTYVTNDVATGGLALLYNYRITGTPKYLLAARGVANYLRNVQSIGKCAYQYTSSDAAQNTPFYTGALSSEVSTAVGIDTGEVFYSTHLFYPSSLLVLEFWNELKTTDGDQIIGATALGDAFTSIPAQLLSTSMGELRACWETGITGSNGVLINGLSSTTPREFFNAYPATKLHFPTITGTGLWQYANADATQISAQTVSLALSALYNYEGATSQVTTISDWLRTFTSNPDFETPDDTSTRDLYRSTTGTYDPTLSLSTMLTVVDADGNATKTNGSSLYDWGAFGLMSRIWAARNRASFMLSRLYPLNTVQRFFDGNSMDIPTDRVILRGESGLTMQTGFQLNMLASDPASTSFASGSTAGTELPGVGAGLVLKLEGAPSWIVAGSIITGARDLSGYDQHFSTDVGFEPYANLETINGVACMTGGFNEGKYLVRTGGILTRTGQVIGYGPTDSPAKTVMTVLLPKTGVFSITGGPVFLIRGSRQPDFIGLFDMEGNFGDVNGFYVESRFWRDNSVANTIHTTATPGSTYANTPLLAEWRTGAFPTVAFAINGRSMPLTPSTLPGALGSALTPYAIVGNYEPIGFGLNFYTSIAAHYVWDYELTDAERTQAQQYVANKFAISGLTQVSLAMVNDAVRAAQFGRSFREARA